MNYETKISRTKRFGNLTTIASFVILCVLPSINMKFRESTSVSKTENRTLAVAPRFPGPHKRELEAFPHEFESFFNDRFGFRNEMVRVYRIAQVNVLGMSPAQVADQMLMGEKNAAVQSGQAQVLPGRDGWLFYTGDRALENYRGTLPFEKSELEHWSTVFHERREWLKARGIQYIVAIAPDKHSIYGEQLPRSLTVVNSHRRIDQFSSQMSEIDVVDLRTSLLAAKKNERVFHRTDTHWNDVGAYYAYRQLAERLRDMFPRVKVVSSKEFKKRIVRTDGGDLANMLAIADHLTEERIKLIGKDATDDFRNRHADFQIGSVVRKTSPHSASPRAVVLHDSFVLAMEQFLTETFSSVTYRWDKTAFPFQAIERDRPDVVIQMFIERTLMTTLPQNPKGMIGSPILWARNRDSTFRN